MRQYETTSITTTLFRIPLDPQGLSSHPSFGSDLISTRINHKFCARPREHLPFDALMISSLVYTALLVIIPCLYPANDFTTTNTTMMAKWCLRPRRVIFTLS